MQRSRDRRHIFLICVALVVVTFVAFEQVRRSGFTRYDDYYYVTENRHVQAGITRESIVWAFTTSHSSNWHPLTWLSHMLDCQFFGPDPFWHHVSNLLFHIANTVLVFWVFKRMTGAVWRSGFVAAAFALHPLHVESVAWVAERKDVLSGLFWMLTMLAYVRYTERPGIGRYLVVFLSLGLGLMAKPMLVTLPFVLLLLDYWPLGRFQRGGRRREKGLAQRKSARASGREISVRRLIAEKIPLFVLAAASSIVTFSVQQRWGATEAVGKLSLNIRISNALVSYLAYIGKMVYPSRLAVLYPFPVQGLPLWQPIVSFVVLAAITIGVVYTARRRRYLVVGWLWYLGTLVPVIGLVQVGAQAIADRYTYIPSIGFFIMVAWGAAELAAKWRLRNIGLGISAGLVLAISLICTRMQVRHWENSRTLFGHAIEVTENNFVMHHLLGIALQLEGDVEEAMSHYQQALLLKDDYPQAHNNLGIAFKSQGKLDKAIHHYHQALQSKPNWATAHNNLAWTLATAEDTAFQNPVEAVKFAEKACELTNYKQPAMLDTLAAAYASSGRFDRAIATAEAAFALARAVQDNELANAIAEHLRVYRKGKPYREPAAKQEGAVHSD